ncbi:MAG: putative phosphoribosyltransferase [Herminiimonas sp.]|nr:putative phosphoribosyltransferase [Herminiimonas sp.]
MASQAHSELVRIPAESVWMEGMLEIPPDPVGIVLFAHGSGSSRLSPRNNYVAKVLRDARLATLLLDLLSPQEDSIYRTRFDIFLLTQRLQTAFKWLRQHGQASSLPVGLFGASTGAAAALQLAALADSAIGAVVSRGGRPDLAGKEALEKVTPPTLLIVGGSDDVVIDLNNAAYAVLHCEKEMVIVPGATHLFEEPGTLEAVAELARNWYLRHLTK